MTTVRSAPPVTPERSARPTPSPDGGGPGERLRRLRNRRRLVREELLVVLVLLIALAVTLLILGSQWLSRPPSTASGARPLSPSLVLPGGTA